MTRFWATTVRLAALAGVLAPLAASAQGTPAPGTPAQSHVRQAAAEDVQADKLDGRGGCFYLTQLQGNHALGDRSVIFRVNVSDFYRLDFAQRCVELTFPDPKLILTPFGGQGLICHAIDLDVKVGEQGPGGFAVPCITSALYKLTPGEIAAIPKKDLP